MDTPTKRWQDLGSVGGEKGKISRLFDSKNFRPAEDRKVLREVFLDVVGPLADADADVEVKIDLPSA